MYCLNKWSIRITNSKMQKRKACLRNSIIIKCLVNSPRKSCFSSMLHFSFYCVISMQKRCNLILAANKDKHLYFKITSFMFYLCTQTVSIKLIVKQIANCKNIRAINFLWILNRYIKQKLPKYLLLNSIKILNHEDIKFSYLLL